MNIHKNARLTFARRLELVRKILEEGVPVATAAAAFGVSVPTARKWPDRYGTAGIRGLEDRTSKPHHSPRATHPSIVAQILDLRRSGLTMQMIAGEVSCSLSTVSRMCASAGMSRLLQSRSLLPGIVQLCKAPVQSPAQEQVWMREALPEHAAGSD